MPVVFPGIAKPVCILSKIAKRRVFLSRIAEVIGENIHFYKRVFIAVIVVCTVGIFKSETEIEFPSRSARNRNRASVITRKEHITVGDINRAVLGI